MFFINALSRRKEEKPSSKSPNSLTYWRHGDPKVVSGAVILSCWAANQANKNRTLFQPRSSRSAHRDMSEFPSEHHEARHDEQNKQQQPPIHIATGQCQNPSISGLKRKVTCLGSGSHSPALTDPGSRALAEFINSRSPKKKPPSPSSGAGVAQESKEQLRSQQSSSQEGTAYSITRVVKSHCDGHTSYTRGQAPTAKMMTAVISYRQVEALKFSQESSSSRLRRDVHDGSSPTLLTGVGFVRPRCRQVSQVESRASVAPKPVQRRCDPWLSQPQRRPHTATKPCA